MANLDSSRTLPKRSVHALRSCAVVLAAILAHVQCAKAQELNARGARPLSESALESVVAMFDYDRGVPFDASSIGEEPVTGGRREAFVITGVRGDRVSGYLAMPLVGDEPHPLVLLMHAGAFSKDAWWTQDSYGGRSVTEDLLRSGHAVLALDAQYHGSRAHNIGFMPIRELYFEREWFARVRDVYLESVGDYRRALDYVSMDDRIDMTRVAALGHSTGGVMAINLAAVDDRVAAVVAAVAALSEPWLFPISPTNVAPRVTAPVLLLAGTTDVLITVDQTQRLYDALPGEKELIVLDSGHELPASSNTPALAWIQRHLESTLPPSR